MKNPTVALSIQQPWAHLIVTGAKDVENRTWKTSIRGPIFIHAGKKVDVEGYDWVLNEMGIVLPSLDSLKTGGIVGTSEIYDCTKQYDSDWFFGPYGFVLRNSRQLDFMRCRGRLGFFNPGVEVVL